MKRTYNILKEFKECFESLIPYCKVLEVSQALTDDDRLITEVYFSYAVDGETSEIYTCHSEVDVLYLNQYDDEKIAKQIFGDIMVGLAKQMKTDFISH